MKNLSYILFLLPILIIQIIFGNTSILAQEDKDTIEIKRIMGELIKSYELRDLESILKYVSTNYNNVDNDGNVIDYNLFKSLLVKRFSNVEKNYINIHVSNLNILNLDIQNDKGIIQVEYRLERFDISNVKQANVDLKREFVFAKEDGSWKVIRWRTIR